MEPIKLLEFRRHLGLTQEELAARLGMSRYAYSGGETGIARFRQLHRMALELLSLQEAVRQGDASLAETGVRSDAFRFADLLHRSSP